PELLQEFDGLLEKLVVVALSPVPTKLKLIAVAQVERCAQGRDQLLPQPGVFPPQLAKDRHRLGPDEPVLVRKPKQETTPVLPIIDTCRSECGVGEDRLQSLGVFRGEPTEDRQVLAKHVGPVNPNDGTPPRDPLHVLDEYRDGGLPPSPRAPISAHAFRWLS